MFVVGVGNKAGVRRQIESPTVEGNQVASDKRVKVMKSLIKDTEMVLLFLLGS